MLGFVFHPLRCAVLMGLLVFTCSGFFACAGQAWPGSGSIADGSHSPDGKFAILLPPREEALEEEEDNVKNLLVDLQRQSELAVIQGAHFFPSRNHRGLQILWAHDGSWCVVTYGERFGFKAVTLLVRRGSGWSQTDLGTHVKNALDAEIARQAGKNPPDCFATVEYRDGENGKIHVTATGTTNPKHLSELATSAAIFTGIFDVRREKWIESEAREYNGE